MSEQKKSNNFILQAGILAAAGIIVRIIGLLYRSPLTAIIGDEGNGYYSFAYNIYANILLISSYSIPAAISKIMAQKLVKEQYRDAQRIFRCALWYVIVVGGIASLFTYFAAPFLVVERAAGVLRIFAPTVFLSGLLGCLRGYFQARHNMVPTSVSQIVEQILNAVVSVGAAYLFVMFTVSTDASVIASNGACGSAVGTGSGVLIALGFMYLVYWKDRKERNRRLREDDRSEMEPYGQVLKTLLLIVTPFILSTFIYNCSTVIDQTIFTKIMLGVNGMPEEEAATLYGIFAGKAIILRNVPVAIASAMSAAVIPTISGQWTLGNVEESCKKVGSAIKATMVIAVPAAVGMAVLSKPIISFLFPQRASIDLAAKLLSLLAVTILFYCISTISNGVLQSIGLVNRPVINALFALLIQGVALGLLLRFTELGLYALVIAEFIYSLGMCLLNGFAVAKNMGYRQEINRTFVKPICAASVMGVTTYGVYFFCHKITGINVLSLFAAIAVAVCVYFVLLIKFGTLTEEEFVSFPKGRTLLKVARKLHLI